jgi:hypothetical protein
VMSTDGWGWGEGGVGVGVGVGEKLHCCPKKEEEL